MSYVIPTEMIGDGEFMSSEYVKIYGSKAPSVYLEITDISVTCYE